MKQIDIFGEETDLNKLKKQSKKCRQTIKGRFRQFHGYYKENKCKDCIYCERFGNRNKTYYKCRKIGITHSEATDIRLKDYACNLFKREDNKQ